MRLRSGPLVSGDLEQALALMWRRVPRPVASALTPQDVVRAWRPLLSRLAVTSRVVASPDLPPHANIVTVGVSAFVDEQWLHEYLRDPFPHPGRFIIESCAAGHADRYLLSDQQVAEANSNGGLHALTLGVGWAPERLTADAAFEGHHRSVRAFIEAHDGYRLAQMVGECIGHDECCVFLGTGSWEPWHVFSHEPEASATPHVLVGMTQRDAHQLRRASAATAPLFIVRAPRYCFDARQQALLLHALDYVCDKDLAQVLGIGAHALRRRWRRIFRRIEALQPPDDPVIPTGVDSAGKRARVLLRMREEMYELRPHTFRRPLSSGDGPDD